MNLTYFKFVFLNTLKRKSLLITWAVFFLMTIILLFVVPSASFTNPLQLWALSATPLFQTFLILIIAIITAILAIIIFKNQYDEGSDLIAISKKITKRGMVAIKFLVYVLFCFIISVSGCISSCFIWLIPSFEIKYLGSLIGGILIANMVSCLVFGSIATVACLKMNNASVLTINLLIVVISFVYQIIGWLTFATPLFTLRNNNIGTTTYITSQRQHTGDYEEKHLVNIVPNTILSQETTLQNISNWQDIKNYWNNQNCSAKSKTYIGSNLINQMGCGYFALGLDKFIQRQASRIFGFSSLYNYELTSPASPEVENNENAIDWIYTGHINADIEIVDYGVINADIPDSFAFPGIIVSDQMAIFDETFADNVPIGLYKKNFNGKEQYVYLEQEQWQKYERGFAKIYDTIFRYDLLDTNDNNYYKLEGIDPCDYQSAWCLKNENLNKYYNLVWACLTNNTNKYLKEPIQSFDFDIRTVDDLNERFIQFKYFAFNIIQKEQKDILDKGPASNEKSFYDAAVQELISFTNKTGIDWISGTWYMTSTHGGTIPYLFLDSHSKVPAFPLFSIVRRYMQNEPQCSYGAIMKTINIYNFCAKPKENYLFSTLNNEDIKRSSEKSGQVCMVEQKWLPAIIGIYTKYNQNWNLFYYTTKRDMPLFIYPIIWGTISLCLLGFSGVVLTKYDIQ